MQPSPALAQEDEISEDTLAPPSEPHDNLSALLSPHEGRFVFGTGEKLQRPSDRHITCEKSVADTILEGRG